MGAYATRSQPRFPHSYCMSAEISRSLTFGFTALNAAKCAATEASTALRISATSPASLVVRNDDIIGFTSRKDRYALNRFRNASGLNDAEVSSSEPISV